MKHFPRSIIVVLVAGMIIEGFRLATQAGMTGLAGSMQNDGYAVSGGLLILIGGIVAGLLCATRAKVRPHSSAGQLVNDRKLKGGQENGKSN